MKPRISRSFVVWVIGLHVLAAVLALLLAPSASHVPTRDPDGKLRRGDARHFSVIDGKAKY